MSQLRWHPLARVELFEAVDFYEARAAGLGAALLEEVERSLVVVREFPAAAAPVRRPARFVLVDRFPYSVVYQVSSSTITILAVAHHKRRPQYWARRR